GQGPRAADARWTLAWMAFRSGDKRAARRFVQYAAQSAEPAERARGLYWAARAGAADAAELMARAAQLDPLGYYGALALAGTGRAASALPAFPPEARAGPPADADPGDDARLSLGRELAQLGLCAEAAAELDPLVHDPRRSLRTALAALPPLERCRR